MSREAVSQCCCFVVRPLPQTTIEAIQEDVLAALENKNPQVKSETAAFLGRCFAKCTAAVLNKKLLKVYVPPLLKTLNESGPSSRCRSLDNVLNDVVDVVFFDEQIRACATVRPRRWARP